MRKMYALSIFIYVAIFLFCSNESEECFGEVQTDILNGSNERWYEIGSYVRKYLFKFYRVTLYTLEPDTIVEMYLNQSEEPDKKEPLIDSLADFLLDPKNHIPLKLTIESLRDCGNYSLQKKAMRNMLERAKFPVDENWNLLEKKEHQKDITLYVKTMMGLSKEEYEALCKKRGKGDRYTLTINSNDETWVKYTPYGENRTVSCEKVCFSSSKLLRGIFSTYISRKACRRDLEDKLPEALMGKILLTHAERHEDRTS
ncbi:MAG: hypothetical protein V2A69_12485 [Pseudomonadota bacterium]